MFGPRLTRVFASRWSALWWAASILFLAWQLTPSADDDGSGPASAKTTVAADPWAISTVGSSR